MLDGWVLVVGGGVVETDRERHGQVIGDAGARLGSGAVQGLAFVYRWNSGTSTYDLHSTLTPFSTAAACDNINNAAVMDSFGFKVVADGNFIAVSAVDPTVSNPPGNGEVFVFEYDSGTDTYLCSARLWDVYEASVSPSVDNNNLGFGKTLDLHANAMVVGGQDPGSASSRYRLFVYSGTAWEHVPDADRGVSADAACVYDHSSGSTAVTIVSMDRETSNYFLYLETWDGTTFEFERLNYDVGIGTGDAALLLKCTADRVFFWAGTVLNSDSRGIRPQSILTLPMYAPSHSFSGTEWGIDPLEVILPGNHEATQPANDEFGRLFDVTRDGSILVASYPGATAYGNAAALGGGRGQVLADAGSLHWFSKDVPVDWKDRANMQYGEVTYLFPREYVSANTGSVKGGNAVATSGVRTASTVLSQGVVLVYDKSFCTTQCVTRTTSAFTASCGGASQCWCGHVFEEGDCVSQEFW